MLFRLLPVEVRGRALVATSIFSPIMKYRIMSLSVFSILPSATARASAFHVQSRRSLLNRAPPWRLTFSGLRAGIDTTRRRGTSRWCSSSGNALSEGITSRDVEYMELAVGYARQGFGHTFPNPAVGCVLVRQDTDEVIGSGFHPRAGMPHAEVFALFEACGHVPAGVDAAVSVLPDSADKSLADSKISEQVINLTQLYTETGPDKLFDKAFESIPVTAYVTLEPCCHYGKTPPCAISLAMAMVDRVVVGFRDPNPRVDGGGVKLLREVGINVDLLQDAKEFEQAASTCENLVECFVKRISPQADREWGDYSHVNGAKRSALRTLCGRKKTNGTMTQVEWPANGASVAKKDFDNLKQAVDELDLDPTWMESVDAELWGNELVLLRLNQAVAKKKGARRLGERIAAELDAHVAQTLGHTVLLYRAGIPPVIQLEELVEEMKS